ncbi:hypothetical protein SUGI_0198040 [Cryptomeria japonica]|uniref:protein MODIFYING WALL LIGNIN-2 n=1 Tax=Cryptomeria japonica TaxID=3369 RepID=UPI002408B5BF|nr:protein MODIFYING WALL LIGNIN-2 [Cryptomeria japonica]GLJ12801.1 hypothetical protein SUGI_0198040 [Cryptomeria japonica]
MEKFRRRKTRQLIGFLGIVAVGTSILAEFLRTKKEEVKYDYRGCSLPGSPALPLGIIAAISLCIAQLSANIMGGCICCCTRNQFTTPYKSVPIVCLTLSWISFVFAIILLMAGCALNQHQRRWLNSDCYVVKPGIFGGAGALSFATTVFAMSYYALMSGHEAEDLGLLSSVMPIATPKLLPIFNSDNSSSTARSGLGIELNPSDNIQSNLKQQLPI